MTSIADLLSGAVESGDVVTICYNGGSRPGEARQVIPMALSKEKLIAVVPSGPGTNKTYKLDLIAWVELPSGERALNEHAQPTVLPKPPKRIVPDVPDLGALAGYVEHYRDELHAAGWHLYVDHESIGVAGYFKNGKPKKTPSIWLRYFPLGAPNSSNAVSETSLVMSIGPDGGLETRIETMERAAPRLKPRPWRVDSWRLPTGKTFTELRQAFALFLEEARHSEPTTAKGAFAGEGTNRIYIAR